MALRWTLLTAATGLGLSLSGCGGGDKVEYPKTAPVKGTVTLDGTPVGGASIALSPVGEGSLKPGRATSKEDGTFEVFTFFSATSDVSGAVPGKYRVTVEKRQPQQAGAVPTSHEAGLAQQSSPETQADRDALMQSAKSRRAGAPPGSEGPPNLLPEKYSNPATSGFEIEVVPDKENTLPLELKSQ